jgi:hypothetical protein
VVVLCIGGAESWGGKLGWRGGHVARSEKEGDERARKKGGEKTSHVASIAYGLEGKKGALR